VVSFCEHYGTVILPTKPAMPRHKGKIEAGIKYVQANGLAGKQFTSLGAQNLHLAHWEQTVADTRIHGTTRQQVRTHFLTIEKPKLLPLPASLFPVFSEAPRKVHRDG
jgi:transposase